MACYVDEAEAWKCPKHPKRRRSGICPKCLRERLVTLCPDCANSRPCSCCPPPVESSTSSSSSSTSFSLFSFSRGGSRRDFAMASSATGQAGLVSNHHEIDPALRRSRSSAIPFLRSRSRYVGGGGGCESEFVAENNKPLPKVSRSKINFWSVFTLNKSKKCDVHGVGIDDELNKSDDLAAARMMRSRSVAVGAGDGYSTAASKRKGWYFPSPIKSLRQPKTSTAVTVS